VLPRRTGKTDYWRNRCYLRCIGSPSAKENVLGRGEEAVG
jgi:hypothetical protein